jgi:DNA-binding GntR family transcriptional regulator
LPAAPAEMHEFRVERIAAPLRHSVTESIRYAIAVGRFKGGDRLPERRLCEMTGVSRTLVREALRQLESEGLIEVVPNRGPIVACVTAEQVKGIYQVRAELEGLAFQLFAEQATTKQRGALVDAFKKLKRSIKDADPLARLRAKDHFYECVMEGSGNDALRESLRLLNARALLLRARSLRAPGRVTTSLSELSELMDALSAKNGKRARILAERHIGNAARTAIALLGLQPNSSSVAED